MMERAEFHEHIGEENVLPHVEAAIERAQEIHAGRSRFAPAGGYAE